MTNPNGSNLEYLQSEWKEMFQNTLPRAAASKSSSQSKWPVCADHCFARIILDATVGVDTPWVKKIKSPAYKNMSREQLRESIELGKRILEGDINLVELDWKSLVLRDEKMSRKRKRIPQDITEGDQQFKRMSSFPPSFQYYTTEDDVSPGLVQSSPCISSLAINKPNEDLTPYLKKIALCRKTDYQKKVLKTLCQIPRGHYTTYAAISKHLASSPRAVGNAIRGNPFAPQVPCHRVLATGGGLGGFKGSWGRKGEAGKNDGLKRKLLRDEGVRFDGSGKVVGAPWDKFK